MTVSTIIKPDLSVKLPNDELPAAFADRSIGELFEIAVARYRGEIALVGRDERLTYGQVHCQVTTLARRIAARVPPGKAVAVLVPNSPASVIAAFACLVAGRTCVLLNADHPKDRNTEILQSAGVHLVVVACSDGPEAVPIQADAAIMIMAENGGDEERAGQPLAPIGPDDPAVVLYTSGSTGRPKGIVLSTRTMLLRAGSNILAYGIGPQDSMLSLNAVGTIAGFVTTLAAFLGGASQHVLAATDGGAGDLLARIDRECVTLIWSVPAFMRMLLDTEHAGPALKRVRVLRLAGEPLLMSDLQRLRRTLPPTCRIALTYGQTEAPMIAQWIIPPDFSTEAATAPAGYLDDRSQCAILGDDGLPVPAGEVGELLLRSRYTALGEWTDGRRTAGRLLEDPDRPGWRILHTGDLVRLRPDSLVEVVGRKDRQLKIRGQRVEPSEVESVLRNVPGVRDAIIVARQSNGDATLIALVVPADLADASLPIRVRQAARAALPPFMQPARIIAAEQVPRLPGGKPDSEAVLALEAATPLGAGAHGNGAKPREAGLASLKTRKAVARAWVRTLGRKSLDADATVEEAGGDSLRFMNLLFRIEEQLGKTLPLDAFHTELTASEIARAVDRCLTAASPPEPDGTACVFLVAGGGARDEPALARFRAACAPLRFELLDMGNWPQWVEQELDLERVIDRLVAQVEERAVPGPLLLAGYSLGGSLAFATALKLQNRGRAIGFLGLLDSGQPPSGKSLDASLRQEPKRLRLAQFAADCRKHGIRVKVLNTLSVVLARRMWALKYLRRVSPLLALNDSGIRLNRFLNSSVLSRVWWAWSADHQHAELAAPVFLFRASEQPEHAARDLGWGKHCPSLSVVSVPGRHLEIFDPPNVPSLARSFSQCVGAQDGRSP